MVTPAENTDVIEGRMEKGTGIVTVIKQGKEPQALPGYWTNEDGPDWGYVGIGPEDMALSILVYCCALPGRKDGKLPSRGLAETLPFEVYVLEVVAKLGDTWAITVDQVRTWIHGYYERAEADLELDRLEYEADE